MKKFFNLILIFFSFIILGVLIFLGYIYFKYQDWEKNFEKEIKIENVITKESTKEIDLGEKISTFALSKEDVEFLELNVSEIGSELFNTLDSNLGEEFNLEKIYIVPSNSKWIAYFQIKYERYFVWLSFDVNKDSIQSPQVYVTEIKVGPFKVSEYINMVDAVNRGIGDSIVTLNENGLVGRYIENIELLNSSVVLKGSRY